MVAGNEWALLSLLLPHVCSSFEDFSILLPEVWGIPGISSLFFASQGCALCPCSQVGRMNEANDAILPGKKVDFVDFVTYFSLGMPLTQAEKTEESLCFYQQDLLAYLQLHAYADQPLSLHMKPSDVWSDSFFGL